MFSKLSRYYKLPDITATDARGRRLASKALRLPTPVSGTLRHTVEEPDRLDHLAYKYYRQPRKWWRIADANPEFLWPPALLGQTAVVRFRFPLGHTEDQPPLPVLIRDLAARVGVEDVEIVEASRLVPETRTHDGQTVSVQTERLERAVLVTFNQLNVSAEALAEIMGGLGFAVMQPERIGRIGKSIAIPRDVVG